MDFDRLRSQIIFEFEDILGEATNDGVEIDNDWLPLLRRLLVMLRWSVEQRGSPAPTVLQVKKNLVV